MGTIFRLGTLVKLTIRVFDAPNKQNGTCLDVADQKDKWAINGYAGRRARGPYHHSGGGRSFCACLIHRDERFVDNLLDEQLTGTGHA